MAEQTEMSFLDHLEELRWHLIRSIGALCLFSIIAFVGKDFFFGKIVLGPSKVDFYTYQLLCNIGERINSTAICIQELPFILQSRKLTGQFSMHVVSSFVIGIIVAFPYMFWEMWRFISPGLYAKERAAARGTVFFISMLFITGVVFGYYIITPLSVNFLSHYTLDSTIANEIDISSYVTTVAMLVLACGFLFQLPMVVYFLSKAGLVTPALMKSYRKHAVVVILILSALLTPPDPFSQVLIAFPLFGLYQISIYISKFVLRKSQS